MTKLTASPLLKLRLGETDDPLIFCKYIPNLL
jgi:hypothetical protein